MASVAARPAKRPTPTSDKPLVMTRRRILVSFGAEGDANSDLSCSLAYDVGQHGVQSDGSQEKGGARQQANHKNG